MRFLSGLLSMALLLSSSTATVLTQDDKQPKILSLRGINGLSQEWGLRHLEETLPENVVVIGGDVGFNETDREGDAEEESEDFSEDRDISSDESEGESEGSGKKKKKKCKKKKNDRSELDGVMEGGIGIEVLGGTASLETQLLASSGAATDSIAVLPVVGLLVSLVMPSMGW
jgi:hypothetical protein